MSLNPRLREEQRRKREALHATEALLESVAGAVRRERLRGRDAIHRRLGRELNLKKMEKHFEVEVGARSLHWTRRQEKIDAEAELDGIYAVRTSLDEDAVSTEQAVAACKSLSQVEAVFRPSPCSASRRQCRPKPCTCWKLNWPGVFPCNVQFGFGGKA